MAQTFSKPAGKISFRKIARAAAAEVRVHKKIAIITYVLYGVALLLFLFNSDIYQIGSMYETAHYRTFMPSLWGCVFAFLGAVVGYFAALNVFRDMSSQQLCDIALALPIKASERFLAKLLCLFYIQIAPLLLSTLVGNGVTIMRIFGDGSFMEKAFDTFFYVVLCYLAGSLFVMAIAVLCACCCGAFAESAYFSLILMFIINVLPASFVFIVLRNCSGFGMYWNGTGNNLGYLGLLFLLVGTDDLIPHCTVSCVLSLAVMLLSGLIFKKRDGRTVGTPIASRVFFEILMFLGCATVYSCFATSTIARGGILIAAVAYLIINVIVSRAKIGIRSFLKWIGKYLATAAVITGILIAAAKTGGFGYISLRPAAQYLEGAYFTIRFDAVGSAIYFAERYSEYKDLSTLALTAEQADQIMTICKKHILQGIAEINTFDFLTWNYDSDEATRVCVTAQSKTLFDFQPSPKSQFEHHFVGSHIDNVVTVEEDGYRLDYTQDIIISRSEARAMAAELECLDFVYNNWEWEQLVESMKSSD